MAQLWLRRKFEIPNGDNRPNRCGFPSWRKTASHDGKLVDADKVGSCSNSGDHGSGVREGDVCYSEPCYPFVWGTVGQVDVSSWASYHHPSWHLHEEQKEKIRRPLLVAAWWKCTEELKSRDALPLSYAAGGNSICLEDGAHRVAWASL